jgi:hypothetical protein
MADKLVNLDGDIQAPRVAPLNLPEAQDAGRVPGTPMSFNDMFNQTKVNVAPTQAIPVSSFYTGDRYAAAKPGEDLEEMYGQQQSRLEQWRNGIAKSAGTFTVSFLGGTAGLVGGIVEAVATQRLAAISDNAINRKADELSNTLEEALPNYETQQERDAAWFSPDNLLTANFWSNKLIKNLGFSVGALYSGVAWAKVLGSMTKINRLVQAGIGKETAVLVEEAMAAAPNAEKYTAFDGALSSIAQKYVVNPILKNGERITISGMGSLAEANIEGLQTGNAFRKQALQDFTLKYGRQPDEKEMEQINDYTDKVNKYTVGANFLLLSLTNYVQVPKMLASSRRFEKALINDIEQKGIGSAWTEWVPSTASKYGGRVKNALGLVVSPIEAFEEGAQFAVQTGVDSYFNKAYRNKQDVSSMLSNIYGTMSDVFGEGVEKALTTKEGMENILIGGLSGGLQQARANVKERGFLGEGGERASNTEFALESLGQTDIQKQLQDQVKYLAISIGSQRARQNAIMDNDILQEKDSEHDYILSYVMPRVKYGKDASVQQELDYYQQQAATEAGFDELVTSGIASPSEERERFIERIQGLKQISKSVSNLYDVINDRYADIRDAKGNPVYSEEVRDKLIYASSKINNYDQRIPALNASLTKAGIATGEILDSIINDGKPNKEATEQALDAINKMAVVSDVKDQLKENLSDVMEMALRRKQFIDEYDKIKTTPEAYSDELPTTIDLVEQPVAEIEQVEETGKKRKSKKVVTKDLEIGKDYSVNQPYRRDGNELTVSPKLQVLSTTLGGEYEVKLPNGKTTFLTPQEFKEYELTEEDNTNEELADIMNAAVDKVLGKDKYSDIAENAPEENKLGYINGLDNKELTDEIENEFKKQASDYFEEMKVQQAEMEKLEDSQEQINELLSTEDDGPETTDTNPEDYEPIFKKAAFVIPNSGVASAQLPGYAVANAFGVNFYKLPNRNKIRAVLVTKKTEDAAGLPGLMDHLAQGRKDVDTNTTIVMVFGEVKGKKFTLVDKNGKPLDEATLDNAVYQVMPLEDLKWSEEFGGESMFRSNTPETVQESIKEEYAKFRAEVLADDALRPYSVAASFGIPDYMENGETTSTVEAGLISESTLATTPVLRVPTSETTESYGFNTYTDASGRVFLRHPGGSVPLKSTQISKAKAELIYQALMRLSELAQERNVNGEEGRQLTDWLSTVVYWGTPVDRNDQRKEQNGRNSVFFETSQINGVFKKLELFISNRGKSFAFTPKVLEAKKSEILEELQNVYHNVKASRVNENSNSEYVWSDKYVEITAINPDGTLKTKTWPNYQTYLLSAEGRDVEDIPLTTPIRPKANDEDINRQGVYFVIDNNDRYQKAVESNSAKPAKTAATPVAKKAGLPAQAPNKTQATGLIGTPDLNNKTVNKYQSPYGPVSFIASKMLLESGTSAGIDLSTDNGKIPAENTEVINKVLEKMKQSNPDATRADAEKGVRDAIARDVMLNIQASAASVVDEVYEEEFVDSYEAEVNPDELAALEEAPISTLAETTAEKDDLDDLMNELDDEDISDARVVVDELVDSYKTEDWEELENFIKEKFPKIPVARVSKMLKTASGRRAFGMYKNGMIYLYKNAEVGTVYHEVFHAVWQMFTTKEERASIVKELRGRSGSFYDRATGESISYKNASFKQLEELMAEEARDYFQEGKLYATEEKKSFLSKLLSDIGRIIKEFFVGKNADLNLQQLLERMDSGYYKNYESTAPAVSFYNNSGIIDIEDIGPQADDATYRLSKFTGQEQHDMVQHMVFMTLDKLVQNEKGFSNFKGIPRKQLINELHKDVQKSILAIAKAAQKSVAEGKREPKAVKPVIANAIERWRDVRDEETWNGIVQAYDNRMKTFDISFDDESLRLSNDPYKDGKGGYGENSRIDNFKNASAAVKLVLATLPMYKSDTNSYVRSKTINGVVLLPSSEAYMAIMNNTHDANNINEFLDRIRQMAIDDINYARVYKRLLNTSVISESVDYSNVNQMHHVQLINSFWRTFKKQNPDVLNTYILENGDIVVGESNFTSASNQLREEFENDIKEVVKTDNPYFKYDAKEGAWFGDANAAELASYKTSIDTMSSFLKTLGIIIDPKAVKRMDEKTQDKFKAATAGIIDSIAGAKKLVTVNGRILDIRTRLLELGQVQAKIENPEFNSTYFNVSGERVQTFIGTNPASDLYDFLSKLTNKNQLKGTKYSYLLTDSFSKFSVVLDRMFDPKTGKRIKNSEELMKTAYADGIVDKVKGKQKDSASLTNRDRLIQEINMNLEGYYMNLVPGDAAMEWMMYMGNPVKNLQYNWDEVYDIFKGYFISELELSREGRKIDAVTGRSNKDLRFFKAIFRNANLDNPNQFHDSIVKKQFVDKAGKKVLKSTEEVYNDNKDQIDLYVRAFITKQANDLLNTLNDYNVFETVEDEKDVYESKLINLGKGTKLDNATVNRKLQTLTTNYIINNIELHKLLYSDPYQYEDELKRIKNFSSPRQPLLHGSNELLAAMSRVYDDGLNPGDIGYSNLTKDSFTTATLSDVLSSREDLPGYEKPFKETDGGGLVSFPAYRRIRILSDNWNDAEEDQYQYDIAFEKNKKQKPLTGKEAAALTKGNPKVKSAYTTIKPIVAGNKQAGKKYNDVILDKFALTPLSYRVLYELSPEVESNALKLYNKMQAEELDYVVFKSSRKVGGGELNDPYDKDGNFNTEKYKGKFQVPVSIVSIQSDVPSKEEALITRGSQVTKLITMNFMQAGVPIDFNPVKKGGKQLTFAERYDAWNNLKSETERIKNSPLYAEIKNNQKLLNEITENGYQTLLKRLGITKGKKGLVVDPESNEVAKTLREELLKREVNVNMGKALDNFLKGDVVLEATPAYQQIRNILYSIADKNVISPKISGGQKVQIPSTFLETVRGEQLENGGYKSDILKFYEKDGKRVAQIMIGRWFKSPLSDAALLKYLNEDPEGQKILSGLAFRIPTQKENSIDKFEIVKFLPYEYGDNVVIPSALVNKVGSDFDIDKLFMYLKNTYMDGKNLKLVPFYGYGEKAKKQFDKMYTDKYTSQIDRITKYTDFRTKLVDIFRQFESLSDFSEESIEFNFSDKDYSFYIDHADLLQEIINQAADENMNPSDYINGQIEKLGAEKLDLLDDLWNTELKEKFVDRMYKQSLENAYIESSENLVSSPENYNQLIKPNSADDLKALAKEITGLRGLKPFDYTNPGNILNRIFMSRLRGAFVTGKYAIGIAAVNQTNHSLNQRQPIYIDVDRFNYLTDDDKYWMNSDPTINFVKPDGSPLYNTINVNGKTYATLSMIRDANDDDFISDTLGQFIDGYVDISKGPWIMELGATPNVASTYMFLTKLGVPINTVAYFMNQPIIRDYLKNLENSGYTWLFNTQVEKQILDKYKSNSTVEITSIPSNAKLKENITKKTFAGNEAAEQVYLLKEFLKYAKMAEHMFKVSQASNFDTATFNDPFLVFRKQEQLAQARKTIIGGMENGQTIDGVDALLGNSFVGFLGLKINDIRAALSNFLKADQGEVAKVLEDVLRPYVNMNERDFLKIAQKATADLFDWSVQVDTKLNMELRRVLLSDINSSASSMNSFIKEVKSNKKHAMHYNHVVKILSPLFSDKRGNTSPNNIMLTNRDNKVYDQNQIIYGFLELKDYLQSVGKEKIYNDLIKASILQSGISNSPISFTSLIPYEDFVKQYNGTISSLDKLSDVNIRDYHSLGVFQRNNWANNDIVPNRTPIFRKDYYTDKMYAVTGFDFNDYPELQQQLNSGKIAKMYRINALARGANSDYLSYTWQDVPLGKNKETMKKQGDYSYIKRGLFRKVYANTNEPLVLLDEKGNEQFVYTMINAWGDSFRANEFYDSVRPSIIDNGFEKVARQPKKIVSGKVVQEATADETDDLTIISLIEGTSVSSMSKSTTEPSFEQTATARPVTVKAENVSKELEDLAAKLNAARENITYTIENINGVNYIVSDSYIPSRIPKGYTKYYSAGRETLDPSTVILYERYGKPVVVPGYEDVKFMTNAGATNVLIELSTGASIFFEKGNLSTIAARAKEYIEDNFSKGKDMREIIKTLPKLGVNGVQTVVSEPQQVSIRGMMYDKSQVTKEFMKSLGLTPKETKEVLEKICK